MFYKFLTCVYYYFLLFFFMLNLCEFLLDGTLTWILVRLLRPRWWRSRCEELLLWDGNRRSSHKSWLLHHRWVLGEPNGTCRVFSRIKTAPERPRESVVHRRKTVVCSTNLGSNNSTNNGSMTKKTKFEIIFIDRIIFTEWIDLPRPRENAAFFPGTAK